ncbi:MAG: GIY-YIG nuclease family protein [Anaerolineales bacterium]|nr:GIY-YIG nuclease family protein [Anaerolineales bacterium]MCW5854789.1 GIY-YIG nuclease family protein [Anaerolineales bacterium]
MAQQGKYYIYILSNPTGTLYTGVTNNLERRIWEHKARANQGFASKYKIDLLMYYEEFDFVEDAIAREKQIKAWRREKKRNLIETTNPTWQYLSHDWF